MEGQIKGFLRTMEKHQDCKDAITQLSASRSAMDHTISLFVSKT
ncbi:metal-sensing transcriptional repressor [Oceanobacillus kapialis]|uniref:Metal-sensing transcriptional repressor n=1 Tax=Oceanobacillus kapialis TaxID=481353 RepID=A0ABW5PWC7_9BACI